MFGVRLATRDPRSLPLFRPTHRVAPLMGTKLFFSPQATRFFVPYCRGLAFFRMRPPFQNTLTVSDALRLFISQEPFAAKFLPIVLPIATRTPIPPPVVEVIAMRPLFDCHRFSPSRGALSHPFSATDFLAPCFLHARWPPSTAIVPGTVDNLR